ncbi:MAG: MaoC family dehydratase [Pseudobdellovibrio sp.]
MSALNIQAVNTMDKSSLNKNIDVGYTASIKVVITDKMVRQFAELSGDYNPIHLDDDYAATTIFKKRIAHGMIVGAIISRCLIETIGNGGIYRGQTLKFYNPIFIDEEITFELTVVKIHKTRGLGVVETVAKKANGDLVAKGEATIVTASGVSGDNVN